jgi:uncharacterized protein YraI
LGWLALNSQGQAPTPLLLAYYGPDDDSAALGLEVAVNEINASGPFIGADGRSYEWIAFPTTDLSQAQNATALLIPANATPPDEAIKLGMPIFSLQSAGDPGLENVEGIFFRAVSGRDARLLALMDYLVRSRSIQGQVFLLGEEGSLTQAALLVALEVGGLADSVAVQVLPSPDDLAPLLAQPNGVLIVEGPPEVAAAAFEQLQAAGWLGTIAYEDWLAVLEAGLLEERVGPKLLGVTSWAYSDPSPLGQAFRQTYLSQTGQVPTGDSVAAYDLAWMLRVLVGRAGADPNALLGELPLMQVINTTQGQVNPRAYGGFSLYENAHVYRVQALGGVEVLGRYDAGEYLGEAATVAALPSPTPQPSATPAAAVITVTSDSLNLRSGPGENYARIGSLGRGDTAQVLGTIPDFSWFYVQTAGGLGWVRAQFVSLFNPAGGLNGLSQVPIPPTPTPGVTATPFPTATAAAPADLSITGVTLNPTRLIKNQQFTATVIVQNFGPTASGPFNVGATWNPGGVATSVAVPSLAAGANVAVILQATLTQAGNVTIPVQVDINNQVLESNEGNNSFNVTYIVDAPPTIDTTSDFAIIQINFAGNFTDLDWTGVALNTLNGATVGVINGIPYADVNVSQLTAANISGATVGTINAGTVFGLRTGQTHCGVMRIENVVGATITISFRMYAIADCN